MPSYLKRFFVFEELENNLHPALQRRLFNYLKDWSIMNKVTVFFTTHSNIPINLFSSDKNSKIVHLTSNRNVPHLLLLKAIKIILEYWMI